MHSFSFARRAWLLTLILCLSTAAGAQDRRPSSRTASLSALTTTSPFEPPKANDYTFVINSGAGLDTGCVFRSGGPLRITLPIGRVLGDLAKLKANGLVPNTVRIEFPAFDVDSDGAPGFPPERDRVTFIGRDNVPHVVPGEFTTGINGAWVMQRFDIPIDWLNLPADPGAGGSVVPANNEIRIDIDTASGTDENWCTAVDWVTITIKNPIPPRPWIGAHGIFSEGNIWNGLWVPRIRDLGIPADPGPNMGRLDTIQNNAVKIAGSVAAARARWGVDRVNIVAHSKGGLDSRHFVENNKTVENLVQLGTPNAGSPLADVVQAGSFLLIGAGGNIAANLLAGGTGGYQLTRPYMGVYNFFHGFNPKVRYMAIGGLHTPGGLFSDPVGRALQAVVGPGDLIVPLSSVHALSYTSKHTVTSAFPPTFGPASHTEIHRNTAAFNIARPLVTGPGQSSMMRKNLSAVAAPGPRLSAVNAGAANGSLQHTKTAAGQLQQPQTATHTIAVDAAGTAAFVLLHPEGVLDLKLTDPNGQVFDPVTIVGRTDVSRQETEIPGGFAEVYAFSAPFAAGNWTATVTAHNTTGPVAYSVGAWLEDAPLQLAAESDRLSTQVGGAITLKATLTSGANPISGATVAANVLLPDGATLQNVTLADDGVAPDAAANDGVYTGRFTGTSQPGAYGVAVGASGVSAGAPFSRETYLSVFATASTSTILSGISDSGRDLNDNSLFDELVLEVPVQITAAGTYRLAATLVDSSGNVLETSGSFDLTPASNKVALLFDGATIFSHGVNGPYQITSVRMAEERGQLLLPLTETTATHLTAPYLFTQFEGAALALNGNNSAAGVDTNGNGKFDLLRADIGVNVRNAGSYQWTARLRDMNGREIDLAGGSGSLPVGAATISVSFDGPAIGRNGVDGPFAVTDLLLFSNDESLSAADVFTTPPIPASAFEGFVGSATVLQFSSATYSATENQHAVEVTVRRTGLSDTAVSVDYRTADGIGSERSDYTTAFGTLHFAPGETSKSFRVLITDDALVEGNETFAVFLSGPTGGAGLGVPDTAFVTIISDDVNASAPNPVDDSEFFVRQHYSDFLGREPDPAGLAFWVNNIESCGGVAACREVRRVNTSAAFFLSIEFQESRFFLVRLQRAAFGRKSDDAATRLTYRQFAHASSQLGEGVVVGQPGFEQRLEQNKQKYAEQVVASPEFAARFAAGLAAGEYVDALYASAGLTPSAAERQQAVDAFGSGGAGGRVAALRKVADSESVRRAEFNPAFVLAEYFGYLRRDPDTPGYDFWLGKLNEFDGDFVRAEMVKAFINSIEYRQRFGR